MRHVTDFWVVLFRYLNNSTGDARARTKEEENRTSWWCPVQWMMLRVLIYRWLAGSRSAIGSRPAENRREQSWSFTFFPSRHRSTKWSKLSTSSLMLFTCKCCAFQWKFNWKRHGTFVNWKYTAAVYLSAHLTRVLSHNNNFISSHSWLEDFMKSAKLMNWKAGP